MVEGRGIFGHLPPEISLPGTGWGPPKPDNHQTRTAPKMVNLVFSLVSGCQSLFVLTKNACFFYNLVKKFISTFVNSNILMSVLRGWS
jgi:hypothetical protein